MARTTRSTTAVTASQPTPNHVVAVAKKRKRVKVEDDETQRCVKRHESQGREWPATETLLIDEPRILDVLEMADALGLLDRVFPVVGRDGHTASLRALLQRPEPLFVLRAAVQHLAPITSAARAVPSPVAHQQRRFCDLALSLLKQAASAALPVPLSLSDILSTEPPSPSTAPRHLRYALVQHLPTGDYWTSLNSDVDLSADLTQLSTAHAELVAILPTPSPIDKKTPPTLASYSSTNTLTIKPLPTHRTVTTSAFLDFGPWSSFAPSFDQNTEVVGPRELAQIIYASHQKRRDYPASVHQAAECSASIEEIPPENSESRSDVNGDLDSALQELFSAEQSAYIKAALDTLELQSAVHELLDRNRRALVRLEELQISRLCREGEKSTAVEGSEELDLAQRILETLEVLCSLRPRTSSSTSSIHSILPPPSVLHKLHRTMALEPTLGWHGTLSSTSSTSLSDDTTVKKSRTTAAAASTSTTGAYPTTTVTTSTTMPVSVTTPVSMPYSGYTFSYNVAAQQQQQQHYRATNGTAAAQYSSYAPQFYPYAAAAAQTLQQNQTAGVPMQLPSSYYGQQQQGYAAAAYSGWYNPYIGAQATTATTTSGSGSGRGTPQPQMASPAAVQMQMTASQGGPAGIAAGTHGSLVGGVNPATRTPAVANTVFTSQVPTTASPVLPTHLRAA